MLKPTDIAVARSDLDALLSLLPVNSKRRTSCFEIIRSLTEFIDKVEETINESVRENPKFRR